VAAWRLRRVGPAVLGGHVSQAAADAALAGALQALVMWEMCLVS